MSLEPDKTTWNPNRYKATEYVITYDSTGNPSLTKKTSDYTGVNYNFSSLPAGNTQTTSTQTANTQTTSTQTADTQQQTTAAFGNVKPYWWKTEVGEGENRGFEQSNMFKAQENTNVSGFFKPLGEAIEGNKPNLGARLQSQFADLTGKTDREWDQVDKDMRIDQIQADLSSGRLDNEEEQVLRTELSNLQEPSFFQKPIKLAKAGGSGIAKFVRKAVPEPIKSKWASFKPLALRAIDAVVPEETAVQKMHKRIFEVDDNGRIAGNPAENLYAGMNRVSAYGNLERAGEKRIATREKTIERKGYGPGDKFYDDTQNMKNEQETYKNEKAKTSGPPLHDFHEPASEGTSGSDSGKSIICTQMYQQTQLEDWKKTMQLWYIFQKKYLTIEHQEGYHFLFKPFVNGMKKSIVLTALGKYCAIARTKDIKHIMFGTPFSVTGRVVRLISEPLCYLVGKIKSWL